MHENRETSETPAVEPDSRSADEGNSRTARAYVSEESHNGIVPMNYSNNDRTSCKATSSTTRYQATLLAYPCSGTGYLCSGGIVFAAAAKSTGSPAPECSTWHRACCLHHKCSMLTPMRVSPLLS